MSYLGGFFRFRIDDRGTQRMAIVGGNVGRRANEDLPSTSEEALSRADATEVITWLRPVGESSANVFLKEIFLSS